MIIKLILQFLDLVSIVDLLVNNHRYLRNKWSWNEAKITNIYEYITYEDDLRLIIRFDYATFNWFSEQLEEPLT